MCIFCEIINGQSPAKILKIWDDAIAIVPLNPIVAGHVLIIPKKHVNNALDNPNITAITMLRAAEFASGQCNIITSVGKDATQSVFHLHVHIVPRHKNDGLLLPWSHQHKQEHAEQCA
jgi:histidine triad (HIT) family protein